MSMINHHTATGPPSLTTCFLACFASSGQDMQPIHDQVNSGSRRRRWISNWTFSCKRSATKTVHVDLTPFPRKFKSVNDAPAKSDKKWEIQVVEEDATLTKKHLIMVDANNVPVTFDGQKARRKKWTDIVKRQNGSSHSRQKETKPPAISAAGAGLDPPVEKPATVAQPSISSPMKPLTHSESLPPQKKQKPPKGTAGGGVHEGILHKSPLLTHSKSLPPPKKQKPPKAPPSGAGVDDGHQHKTLQSGGDFDCIIAMSVLLTILVIMLLWGKLCAIICTSAWFFIAPRLVAAGKHSAGASEERKPPEYLQNDLNLESVEYKKKVVLEGLLQRNHRNVACRL